MSLPPLPSPQVSYAKCSWAYTAEQMQAYGQACREAALDKAAQVCDAYRGTALGLADCANEIRKLK